MARNLQVKIGVVDPAAKSDIITLNTSALKPWSVINDLRYDNVALPGNYMTNEHNYSILDGTMQHFPNTPNTPVRIWGYWSDVLSDGNGDFTVYPTLDITFGGKHKSPGLTIYFYPHTDDYASLVDITWYDISNVAIKTGQYTFTSDVGQVIESVVDYNRVRISFRKTNIRNRFVKIFAIDFGLIRVLFDPEISMCKIRESIDPTVEKISINNLNLKIRTRNSLYNPITSDEFDDMIMERQPLSVYRDDELFGVYFIDEWKDPEQTGITLDIKAEDAMAALDSFSFKGGIYVNKPVVDLLNEIFLIVFPTGLIGYELDSTFVGKTVTGWIPYTDCGTAFQLIMFALSAIADTSRRDYIWIYPLDTVVNSELLITNQYIKGEDRKTEYYSGVDITAYSYSQGSVVSQVYKDDNAIPGQITVKNAMPLHTYTVVGSATIVQSHPNYVTFNVNSAGAVQINALEYVQSERVFTERIPLVAGKIEKIKEYTEYTLTSPNIAQQIAINRMNWFNKGIRSKNNIELDNNEVGYLVEVETRGRDILGHMTNLNYDLRANKAESIVVGNVVQHNKLSTLVPGSVIKIPVAGQFREFFVAGHNYTATGKTLVLQRYVYDSENRRYNNVITNYPNSEIDLWLQSIYLNNIHSDFVNLILNTTIQIAYGTVLAFSSRRVFLLSATELGLGGISTGQQIGYNLNLSALRECMTETGYARQAWTRTPVNWNSGMSSQIYSQQHNSMTPITIPPANSSGVRPAFTLPSDLLIKHSGRVVI